MILLDSSVMIDALRKPDPKLQNLFNTLQPAICGIVFAEVLHGSRDAVDYSSKRRVPGAMPTALRGHVSDVTLCLFVGMVRQFMQSRPRSSS